MTPLSAKTQFTFPIMTKTPHNRDQSNTAHSPSFDRKKGITATENEEGRKDAS